MDCLEGLQNEDLFLRSEKGEKGEKRKRMIWKKETVIFEVWMGSKPRRN